MIDTIRMNINEYELNTPISFLEEVSCKIRVDRRKSRGNRVVGWLDNMKVDIKNKRLTLEGSLSKWMNGNNVYGMEFGQIKEAIDRLGERLGFSLYNARVTRIDIAQTFKMECKVPEYLKRLHYMEGFNNFAFNAHCRYFEEDIKYPELQMCFYDKVKERVEKKERKKIMQYDWDRQQDFLDKNMLLDANLLRYELRILKVRNVFHRKITCLDLFSGDFYGELVELWSDMYEKVEKHFDLSELAVMQDWNGISQLKQNCLELCMIAIPSEITNEIEKGFKEGKVSAQNKSNALKLVRKIREEVKKKYAKASLVDELNAKIENEFKNQVVSIEMHDYPLPR